MKDEKPKRTMHVQYLMPDGTHFGIWLCEGQDINDVGEMIFNNWRIAKKENTKI